MARARLLVLSGRAKEALALLAPVTHTPHEFIRLRLEALLLAAQAHDDLGNGTVAATCLGKAAAYPQFLSTFVAARRSLIEGGVEAVPALGPILARIETHELLSPYPASLDVVNLTDRERQLVGLLLTSLPRDAIARKQFVSTNTIKTQLNSLYRKLRAGSRDEAVARAYELGLVR